jgi:tetratricopeptide (TPR) repeat protein
MAQDEIVGPPVQPIHSSHVVSTGNAPTMESKLHTAAKENKPDEVQKLLEARADIEVRDRSWGWSALHVAAGSGACQAAEKLLEHGAKPDVQANDKETPLHLAAADGQTQLIKILVESRADVNARSGDGETPLHVAVQHIGGKPGLGHIKTLLDLRADVAVRDKNDHNAWETAGLYTNRADEIRNLLGGAPIKNDPDDPWPDTPGELDKDTDPVDVAESLRELGNKKFKEGLYEEATKFYFKAKVFLPSGPAAFAPVDASDEKAVRARACYIAVSSNAAACKLKKGEHEVVVRMCDGILRLDANNVKALYRKGLSLHAMEALDDAEEALRQASSLAPDDKAILQEINSVAKKKKGIKDKEKKLAQKMFA